MLRFKQKLIMYFAIFALVSSLALGTVYYLLNVREYSNNRRHGLALTAEALLRNMDEKIIQMDSVFGYLLSEPEVLTAIRVLGRTPKYDSYSSMYFSDAANTVRLRLNADFILSNYYKVIVFNRTSSMVHSYSANKSINSDKSIRDISWLDMADTALPFLLVGDHVDDWALTDGEHVISLVKKVHGNNMGYIEVQQDIASFDETFKIDNENIHVFFYNSAGEILYSNWEIPFESELVSWVAGLDSGGDITSHPTTRKTTIVATQQSSYSNVHIAVLEPFDYRPYDFSSLVLITLSIVVIFAAISLAYIFIVTRYITKPIVQLQSFINHTKLDNMQDEMGHLVANDEIEELYYTYKKMLDRLSKAISKEKHLSFLQLQAQYDLLQTQVNPHFIYNVLNLIADRGMDMEDDVVCELCQGLSGMLRYSTNTKDRVTTVEKELNYLKMYFSLLKYRYEHKLDYSLDISDALKNHKLPRIVLQQIVENSVVHGYRTDYSQMQITVSGYEDDEKWYVEVADNGDGIPKEQLRDIIRECERQKWRLQQDDPSVELKIGGSGLPNIYARFFLLYKDDLLFEVMSDMGGTKTRVGAIKRGR